MNIKPSDMGVWLDYIDVNCLSADDQERLAEFDIDSDDDLRQLISQWLKPHFEENNAQSKSSMRAVLEQSKEWSAKDLSSAFEAISFPSGQEIKDIERFMRELRQQILT